MIHAYELGEVEELRKEVETSSDSIGLHDVEFSPCIGWVMESGLIALAYYPEKRETRAKRESINVNGEVVSALGLKSTRDLPRYNSALISCTATRASR
jgi:hypothetical protein